MSVISMLYLPQLVQLQFNAFGRLVIALLIQIGGLGVTSVGAIFILVMQRKFGVYHRLLLMEGLNFNSLSGVV